MTVPRIKTSAGWVDLQKVGPQGPPAFGSLLAMQERYGAAEAYSGAFAGNIAPFNISDQVAGSQMLLTYTPPVNAWWEITAEMALLQKQDAAYHYTQFGPYITPAPPSGPQSRLAYLTGHSTVMQFLNANIVARFPLTAGIAYTASMRVGGGNGGTWVFYHGPNHLAIEGKAWAR